MAPITTIGNDGSQSLTARSYHTGGVNGAMADGSVRFIRNGVNAQSYGFMGSRAGGEVLTDN